MPNVQEPPILVTGGAGFIGTHLCHALLGQNKSVRVLDLKLPDQPVPRVDYRQGDIRNPRDLMLATHGVQAVFHFAAIVSVPLCQEDLVTGYATNLTGTLNVLEAVRVEKTRSGRSPKLIFASSAAVYGNALEIGRATTEDMAGPAPQSFYGAQKLASEQAIQIAHQVYGVPSVIFRFFNVFGKGQDPSSPYSGVISVFKNALEAGRPLLLNGGGTQTRDFISVHDVVLACIKALDLPKDQYSALPINLGTGQSTTILQLADSMIRASGRKVATQSMPPREGDLQHSLSDTSRAREILNWTAQTQLDNGLADLLSLAKDA